MSRSCRIGPFSSSAPRICRAWRPLWWLCCWAMGGMPLLVSGTQAATLDFGWSAPFEMGRKTRTAQETYLVWPIQISNNTRLRLAPELDIVMVTDTGEQYQPLETLRVRHRSLQRRRFLTVAEIRGLLFPAATRRALVVFQDVDPRARVLHFYVGGLSLIRPCRQGTPPYLWITYRKTQKGWTWDTTRVLE